MLSRLWNAGYTFLAALSATILTLLAVLGGASVMWLARFCRDFRTGLPDIANFYLCLGLTGIFCVWALCLLVIAALFLDEDHQRAAKVILITSGIGALYLGGALLAPVAVCARITWSVTGS